jgi:hypothetical protein
VKRVFDAAPQDAAPLPEPQPSPRASPDTPR